MILVLQKHVSRPQVWLLLFGCEVHAHTRVKQPDHANIKTCSSESLSGEKTSRTEEP